MRNEGILQVDDCLHSAAQGYELCSSPLISEHLFSIFSFAKCGRMFEGQAAGIFRKYYWPVASSNFRVSASFLLYSRRIWAYCFSLRAPLLCANLEIHFGRRMLRESTRYRSAETRGFRATDAPQRKVQRCGCRRGWRHRENFSMELYLPYGGRRWKWHMPSTTARGRAT
jgi:hypothetical protein